MLEKPDLQDEALITCLRVHYGLPVCALEFLPIGYDSSAWVYRVETDDATPYFLKVRRGVVYEPSLRVPHALHAQGIAEVVAPLAAQSGALWQRLDSFSLILYPFIEGRTGMDGGMTAEQWMTFGRVLKQIHSLPLAPELQTQVVRETFTLRPQWMQVIQRLQAEVPTGVYRDPAQRVMAAFWDERRAEIEAIVRRAEMLGRLLEATAPEQVLCHADIHTANVLIDGQGCLFIVDWDGVLLAPVERDLMFVVGAHEEDLFFTGYGAAAVDPLALAYYRYEWVVQELGDFGERVFWLDDVGAETRQDSVRGFRQLFDPGDVVEAAYQSEDDLPPEYADGG
ncbi:MAG: aminoglycoside phosphotransferase family protein [Anaerolineae bacterium]|nr:aminoglycoside phosphotransferase family protein [Anaerolineae bacterium]